MINSSLSTDSNIAVAKNGTGIKSLFSKMVGLSLHMSIFIVGTTLAEYAWRAYGACYKVLFWLSFNELLKEQTAGQLPQTGNRCRGHQLRPCPL